MSYFSKNFKESIPKGYVIFVKNIPVNGIRYEYEEAVKFIRSKEAQSLLFTPEPQNPQDTNAIKVMGITPSDSFFLGYVPKAYAKQIADSGLIDKVKPRLMRIYRKEKFLDVIFQVIGLKEDKSKFDEFQPIEPASERQLDYLELMKIEHTPNLTFADAYKTIINSSPEAESSFKAFELLMEEIEDQDFLDTYGIEQLEKPEIIEALKKLISEGNSLISISRDSEILVEELNGEI